MSKQCIMTSYLRIIGQMKDMIKSKPKYYYKRVEKKSGNGFTYFFTKGEYDKYVEHKKET